jgi:hypothetical protein
MPNSGSFSILFGLGLERLSAFFGAEVKSFATIGLLDGRVLFIYLHAANWIEGHKNPPSWRETGFAN